MDGVLNSRQSYKKNNGDRIFYGQKASWNIELLMKSYYKILLLKDVCSYTGAEIVCMSAKVTSIHYPLVEERLVNMGLPIVDSITSEYGRANAIQKYLMSHEVDNFIVLDDDLFAGYEEFLNNIVKTDFYNDGLTEEIAEEIKMALRPKKTYH